MRTIFGFRAQILTFFCILYKACIRKIQIIYIKEDPSESLYLSFSEGSSQNPLFSGANGIRTHDLCVANAALSQLSYDPIYTDNIDFLR